MAAQLEAQNLDGFANFFTMQAQEEVGHAMKFYAFINERGNRVVLEAIDKPQAEFKDVEEIFNISYKHEQFVTQRIHKLVDLAIVESDHASKTFLDWFVTEQVEEEASMDAVLQKIRMVGVTGHGLLMLDAQLAKRGAAGGSAE
jgi:ferritin